MSELAKQLLKVKWQVAVNASSSCIKWNVGGGLRKAAKENMGKATVDFTGENCKVNVLGQELVETKKRVLKRVQALVRL